MPKPLLKRCSADSIRSFRSAASVRFTDGVEAADANRRTAAIYLWGYAAEKTLKAAYFAAVGFVEHRPISHHDLHSAWQAGTASYGMSWPKIGKFHNIRAWCDLLVAYRSSLPSLMYSDPAFGAAVKQKGEKIEPIWDVTLRYHHNIAYQYEVNQMKQAVAWLFKHSLAL